MTGDGKTHESLLLYSGFWGISRHLHYVFEWILSFCWIAPVGYDTLAPWFYMFFMIVLLTDRAMRDERRCKAKYGKYWDQFCEEVPWFVIPGVY